MDKTIEYFKQYLFLLYDLGCLRKNTEEMRLLLTQETEKIDSINLQHNEITFESIILFGSANWLNLTDLQLGNNKIGCQGCKYLTRIALQHLEFLGLFNNLIECPGVSHLSKGNWNKLAQTNLGGNQMKAEALGKLTKLNSCWLDQITLGPYGGFFTQVDVGCMVMTYWNILEIWLRNRLPKKYRQRSRITNFLIDRCQINGPRQQY